MKFAPGVSAETPGAKHIVNKVILKENDHIDRLDDAVGRAIFGGLLYFGADL